MTVKELKELLEEVPDDLTVAFLDACDVIEEVKWADMSFTVRGIKLNRLILRGGKE